MLSEILCKREWPSRTYGETTYNSRTSTGSDRRRSDSRDGAKHRKQHWRPLLLFIPLRLGLSEMNSVYNEPFKVSFIRIVQPHAHLPWQSYFKNPLYERTIPMWNSMLGSVIQAPTSNHFFNLISN